MDSCFEARIAVFLVVFLLDPSPSAVLAANVSTNSPISLVPSTIQPNGTTTISIVIPVPPDIMTKTTTTVVILPFTNSTDATTRMAETWQSSIVAASTNAPATNATTIWTKRWKRKTTTTPRPTRIRRPIVTDPYVDPTKWLTTTPIPGFAKAITQTDPGAPPTEVGVDTYVRCPFDRRCILRCAQPGQSTDHIKSWKSNRFIAGFLPPHPVQSPYLERNGRYIVLQRVVNNRTKLGAQYDTQPHLGYSHIPDYLGDLNDLMYSIERKTSEGDPIWTGIETQRADKYFYEDGRLRPTMVDAHEVSAVWRRGNGFGNNVTDLDFGPVPLALTSPNGHDGDFPKLVSPENGPPQFVLWTDGSLTILNTVRGQQPYFACYNRWDSTNGKLLTDPKDFQFIASYVVDRVPAVTVTNGRGRDFRRGTTDTTLSPQSPKDQTISCTISTFGTSLQDYHVSWWKDGKLFLDVPMKKSGRLPETLKTYCSTSKRMVMANVTQIFDSPFVDRPDLIRAHLSFLSTPGPYPEDAGKYSCAVTLHNQASGDPSGKPIPNEVGDPGTVMWVDTPGENVTNFRAAVNRTANTVSFEWEYEPYPGSDPLSIAFRLEHRYIPDGNMTPPPSPDDPWWCSGTSEAIVPYIPYAEDDIDPYQMASLHIQADPAHPLFGWHKYSVVPWCDVQNGSLGSSCGPRSVTIEFHVPSDPCELDPPFFTIPSDPVADPAPPASMRWTSACHTTIAPVTEETTTTTTTTATTTTTPTTTTTTTSTTTPATTTTSTTTTSTTTVMVKTRMMPVRTPGPIFKPQLVLPLMPSMTPPPTATTSLAPTSNTTTAASHTFSSDPAVPQTASSLIANVSLFANVTSNTVKAAGTSPSYGFIVILIPALVGLIIVVGVICFIFCHLRKTPTASSA